MWLQWPATVDLYPDGSSFTAVVVLVRHGARDRRDSCQCSAIHPGDYGQRNGIAIATLGPGQIGSE